MTAAPIFSLGTCSAVIYMLTKKISLSSLSEIYWVRPKQLATKWLYIFLFLLQNWINYRHFDLNPVYTGLLIGLILLRNARQKVPICP